MSGICGWFDVSPALVSKHGSEISDRMASGLPPSGAHTIRAYTNGMLCNVGPDSASIVESVSTLAAAIVGKPRWAGKDLASYATQFGDGAALIAAYKDYGESFVKRLSGPFSFALVDYEKGRTILAVDRMGIRPLCYATTGTGEVVFGTTTTSVLAHPAIRPILSNESIYRYFYFHVIPSPATIFDNIVKLEPAQIVSIDGTSIHKNFYWAPDPGKTYGPSATNELLSELRSRTREAVARTVPDETTGCFLSGGLDSSTISGLANEITDRPIRTYTVGFDQHGFDEMSFARIAAQHFNLHHVEYYVTPADVASAFNLLSTAYDEPFGNSSAIPAYFCAVRAKRDGMSRLLAGDGGDELFAGNERYEKQKLFQQYFRIPGVVRNHIVEPAFDFLPTDWSMLTRKARRYIEQAKIGMPDRLQTYNFLQIYPPSDVFEPTFLKSIDIDTPILEMRSWYERSRDFDFLDRMLQFDWKLTLADNDIRKVNRMCEAAGVSVDYPLLDDDLVDFSLKLPPGLKTRRSELRYAFKRAFRDYLPRPILEKEKHGFGLPFGDWLNTSDELRATILPCIDRFRDREILQDAFIDDILRKHRQEHAGFYGTMLWLIAVLDNWLATKID